MNLIFNIQAYIKENVKYVAGVLKMKINLNCVVPARFLCRGYREAI
jgi:hypothetical protein